VQGLFHGVGRVVARVEGSHAETHPRQEARVVVDLLHGEEKSLEGLQPVLHLPINQIEIDLSPPPPRASTNKI